MPIHNCGDPTCPIQGKEESENSKLVNDLLAKVVATLVQEVAQALASQVKLVMPEIGVAIVLYAEKTLEGILVMDTSTASDKTVMLEILRKAHEGLCAAPPKATHDAPDVRQ